MGPCCWLLPQIPYKQNADKSCVFFLHLLPQDESYEDIIIVHVILKCGAKLLGEYPTPTP